MKVTSPSGGGGPKNESEAATASRISSEAGAAPSLRKAEHIHAPAHACWTNSAKGHDVTQNARPVSVSA
jgi:hypothetical protein